MSMGCFKSAVPKRKSPAGAPRCRRASRRTDGARMPSGRQGRYVGRSCDRITAASTTLMREKRPAQIIGILWASVAPRALPTAHVSVTRHPSPHNSAAHATRPKRPPAPRQGLTAPSPVCSTKSHHGTSSRSRRQRHARAGQGGFRRRRRRHHRGGGRASSRRSGPFRRPLRKGTGGRRAVQPQLGLVPAGWARRARGAADRREPSPVAGMAETVGADVGFRQHGTLFVAETPRRKPRSRPGHAWPGRRASMPRF